MLATMSELAKIVENFRTRYHLPKSKAAKVLGVSVTYVRSLEEGHDVHTGLPFAPREATLRQIAGKMTEFGYPMTYEQLAEAAKASPSATYSTPVTLAEDQDRQFRAATTDTERDAILLDRQVGNPVMSVVEGLGVGDYPPTEWEQATMDEAFGYRLGFPTLQEPGFWRQTPEARRSTFLLMQQGIEDAKTFYRLNSGKKVGRKA